MTKPFFNFRFGFGYWYLFIIWCLVIGISLCCAQGGTSLHPNKNLAVSPLLLPKELILKRIVLTLRPKPSLLASLPFRATGVTRYSCQMLAHKAGCPDFPPLYKSIGVTAWITDCNCSKLVINVSSFSRS